MGQHEEYKSIVDARKRANEEKYEAVSKANLQRHVGVKIKTTMIGALSQFEEHFGELWGQGIPEDQLNEDELYYRDKWELARTEILNNGNNQGRAADQEIDKNTVRYIKDSYSFKMGRTQELTDYN